MARLGAEHLADMSDEGKVVRARRERLGLSGLELARETETHGRKVNRNTIASIEAGKSFNRTTLARLQKVLDELEAESGLQPMDQAPEGSPEPSDAEPHIIIVRLKNDVGEVAVEGPVDDLAELEAAARRLLRGLREDQ